MLIFFNLKLAIMLIFSNLFLYCILENLHNLFEKHLENKNKLLFIYIFTITNYVLEIRKSNNN